MFHRFSLIRFSWNDFVATAMSGTVREEEVDDDTNCKTFSTNVVLSRISPLLVVIELSSHAYGVDLLMGRTKTSKHHKSLLGTGRVDCRTSTMACG